MLSHATDENFKNLENNAVAFSDFKHCTTWHKMWGIYYQTLEDCLSYLCSENFITKTEQIDRLIKMQNVRSHVLHLQKQFIDDFTTKMFNIISQALATKTDLEQAKCEIIERNDVTQKQQYDGKLFEKIQALKPSLLLERKFVYKTNNFLLYIF